MKTLFKNLKSLSRVLTLGGLIFLGGACGGNGSQGIVQAPGAEQVPVTEEKPVIDPAPTQNLKTCYTYTFVSDRTERAQNVFLADTCNARAPRQLTANRDSQFEINNLAFNANGTKLTFDHVDVSTPRNLPAPTLMTPPASPDQFATSIEINSADLGGNGSGDFFPQTLAFEPQGNRIAFIAVTPQTTISAPGLPATQIFPQSIQLFDPAAGVRDLVSNTDEAVVFDRAVWTPDSSRLIFSKQDATLNTTILVYDLANDRAFDLRESSGGLISFEKTPGFSPALRPDGNVLAFVRRNKVDNKDQIFTCTLDLQRNRCEGVTALTSLGSNILPSWTPDGQFILFTSDRDGNREIYQMKADGSDQVRLTQDPTDDLGSAVSPVSFQIHGN